jgi:protein SCO1/2
MQRHQTIKEKCRHKCRVTIFGESNSPVRSGNGRYKELMVRHILIIVSLLNMFIAAWAQNKPEAGIEEQLGYYVPADANFYDESGRSVNFKSLVDKPTILSLVYYRCPGLCSPLLQGVAEVIDKVDMEPGKDYNMITVSFDTRDNYLTAAEKKSNYFSTLQKKIPDGSWRFLTGDSLNIAKLTNSVGWRFQKQPDGNFAHGSAIMVLSPDGKIVRYLFGVTYLPFDVKMALTEASAGKVEPSISKFMQMCYSYDPEGRKYVFNVTKVAGIGMVLFVIGLFLFLTLRKKESIKNA